MSSEDATAVFSIFDYVVFATMLIISSLIGIYFAYFAKVKQNTPSEYLMGSKSIGVLPMSMSLLASYVSGISLLGFPAEMYTYGTQLWMVLSTQPLVALTLMYIFLPVYYKLQLTSTYEYLNLRFNHTVRLLGSVLFLIETMLYIPIVIYVPALAFNQVTGINLHLITPAVCIICIFYTTLGGLKAVVWTDAIQTVLMFASMIVVVIMGMESVGGFSEVWKRNQHGDRLDFFNLDWDPTLRHTLWTVAIGHYFSWLATCSVNQTMAQRFLAMPTLKSARLTVILLVLGMWGLVSLCCCVGLIIYAYYHKCDPITNGSVAKSDQLVPYFVMHVATVIPGLPGLFVSGVFSAALSSMSTGLNSMTGVIFEDFIKPKLKKPLSAARASFLMKIMVVVIGTICVALVFVVENLGMLIQATLSLGAITAGPTLGIFVLGMFFPGANSKGAIVGGVVSGSLIGWISIGTQMKMAQGVITFPKKNVSIEGCDSWVSGYLSSVVAPQVGNKEVESVFALYRMSYMYYTVVGAVVAVVVGYIVSLVTGGTEKQVHRDLLSPIVHRFLNGEREADTNNRKDLVMDTELT
ncbi:sodium-coupled monocarboxylate transporter 1-like [Zophobas morio]|uniref:sodium-coupled monocarboxylate transporter 1-like n=1 Tax=Zophobas morio TaxID=2755281 RepID=UPI0030835ED6